ncbi:MAG TPA: amidohydrolase [Planctomycetota bacterium]|jgi:hypothetical protein|nr:amidohydrolase [Planctomycetota bacterium]
MLASLLPLAVVLSGNPEPADLVLRAGKIHTVHAARPAAKALAVRGGRIVAVGEEADVAPLLGPQTAILEFPGATVVPGLIDAHAHFASLGQSLETVDLVGTKSFEEVVARVAARARETPKGRWVIGRGWDQNDWEKKEFPDHRALSAAVPENPVWLSRIDGHAGLANAAAMALAGLDPSAADPPGGKVHRFPDGSPTGVFVDDARGLVARKVPGPSKEDLRRWILRAQEECLKAGLTGVHDAGVGEETIATYRELADSGELRLRVYAMFSGDAVPPDRWSALHEVGRRGVLTARAIKIVADGALGSRGAALLEDYADDPGNRGLLTTPPERVEALCGEALARDIQVCVHAIGDRGNRLVLDAFEKVWEGKPRPDLRWRIEHAQVVSLEDLPRFARLGVIPSMQPTHATSDGPWAPARVGPERMKGAYAWRRFLDAGCRIAAGSDFPVESPDPRKGLFAAITREPESGGAPFDASQRMTPEEALRSFTLDAAAAAFEEKEKGSLEPGKLADFVVLDRDPLAVAPREILAARVLATFVGGARVSR